MAALDIDEKGVRPAGQGRRREGPRPPNRRSDPEDCRRQVAIVPERFGTVHILVNNAALGMNSVADDYDDEHLQIEDVPDDLWRRFFAVNVGGAFSITRAVAPIFRKQKWGRVINVSTSILTMIRKGFVPYGPTKAALEAWSLIQGAAADSRLLNAFTSPRAAYCARRSDGLRQRPRQPSGDSANGCEHSFLAGQRNSCSRSTRTARTRQLFHRSCRDTSSNPLRAIRIRPA